ncbi:sirohydrochlorin chelatase [Desulfofalx alkaliphila]|uniref:sirohydrochlorin chelatase n=1 Tax=Desulfofalx alkaliphila TaxID=105483 RepID=UPI0004E0E7B9|nr:CbiX/SirB N-terminal domain-containing protein [Desulfofalx alkaliphila]
MKEGVLLLGHGSRRDEGNVELRQILEEVKKRGPKDRVYQCSFLQFTQPTLDEGIKYLVSAGVEKIIVVPLFLVSGTHIRQDIPNKLMLQKNKHPHIKFVYAEHLGSDARIADIVLDRIKGASRLVE